MKILAKVIFSVFLISVIYIDIVFAGLIEYNPESYTFLEVTKISGGSGGAGINNFGEIVYPNVDSTGNLQVYSTQRGQLTYLTPSSSYNQVQSCDINDAGEVVYVDIPLSHRFSVFSTVSGFIGKGYGASIANSGEISFSSTDLSIAGVYSSLNGLVKADANAIRTGINDTGEIVYSAWNGGGISIFSTIRGQITSGTAVGDIAINNYGDIAYSDNWNNGTITILNGLGFTELKPFPESVSETVWISSLDINDYGDLVFSVHGNEGDAIVLGTQNPGFYSQYNTLDPWSVSTPLPDTILLLATGLIGIVFKRQRCPKFNLKKPRKFASKAPEILSKKHLCISGYATNG